MVDEIIWGGKPVFFQQLTSILPDLVRLALAFLIKAFHWQSKDVDDVSLLKLWPNKARCFKPVWLTFPLLSSNSPTQCLLKADEIPPRPP